MAIVDEVLFMNRGSTVFLKAVLLLIGMGTLAGMVWFPQTEGRNVNSDLARIYLQDPLLAYTYVASIPFFLALHQAFRLLGYIERNLALSRTSVGALRNIKHCAIAITGFVAGGVAFVILGGEGDRAGAVAMGVFAAFASIVIATAMAVSERHLQSAVDRRSRA
jgi:hypothetical protein